MLNHQQLKEYRLVRGLTLRDVAWYSTICRKTLMMVESGKMKMSKHHHDEIVRGINSAYQAKKDGSYFRPPFNDFTQYEWDYIMRTNNKKLDKYRDHYRKYKMKDDNTNS